MIISYRELRLLEIDLLKALRRDCQLSLDVSQMCQIDVDQFCGIELDEFPARNAEVALWMMDHLMNNKLSLEFGESYVRIPLKKSPRILPADALETDWASLIDPAAVSYTHLDVYKRQAPCKGAVSKADFQSVGVEEQRPKLRNLFSLRN